MAISFNDSKPLCTACNSDAFSRASSDRPENYSFLSIRLWGMGFFDPPLRKHSLNLTGHDFRGSGPDLPGMTLFRLAKRIRFTKLDFYPGFLSDFRPRNPEIGHPGVPGPETDQKRTHSGTLLWTRFWALLPERTLSDGTRAQNLSETGPETDPK